MQYRKHPSLPLRSLNSKITNWCMHKGKQEGENWGRLRSLSPRKWEKGEASGTKSAQPEQREKKALLQTRRTSPSCAGENRGREEKRVSKKKRKVGEKEREQQKAMPG